MTSTEQEMLEQAANLLSPSAEYAGHQILIRKHLLYSAVSFLNSPKMRATSSGEKTVFLLKKGLTQDEIDLVFQLCISRPATEASLKSELELLTASLASTSNSLFDRLLKLAFYMTVFGGAAYGSYLLYQTLLRPLLFPEEEEEKEAEARKSANLAAETNQKIALLSEQISELQKSITIVQEFVRTYCRARDDSLFALKADLGSVKSLLVSRDNFPSVPTIPKWQIESTKKKSATATNNTSTASSQVAKNGTGAKANSGGDSSGGESSKSD